MQRADAVLLQLWYRARHRHLSGQFRYLHKYLLSTVRLDIYTNIYHYLHTIYCYLCCQGEGDGMMKTLEEINVEQ